MPLIWPQVQAILISLYYPNRFPARYWRRQFRTVNVVGVSDPSLFSCIETVDFVSHFTIVKMCPGRAFLFLPMP
jgi:hypothetical protein